MRQIIHPVKLNQLVAQYEATRDLIIEGYQSLKQAQAMAEEYFPGRFVSVVDSRISVERAAEKALGRLKKGVWRQIVHQTGVRKILSIKRARELDANLDDAEKLPDISVQSVLDYLATLRENSKDLASESVKEVFQWLRPYDRYKTNDHWQVGKKVILTNCVELRGGQFRVSYYKRPELSALDQVFHLLDGAGIPDGYHCPLVDGLNTLRYGDKGETTYFEYQAYKNGNVHVTFKRPDLVQELNRIAGGEMVLNH
jgi:hypothetical protein